MTSTQQPSGTGFSKTSDCPNISGIIALAKIKVYHGQSHNYLLFEMQKSCVALLVSSSPFSSKKWEHIVSCSTHLFLQNWASESFLREVFSHYSTCRVSRRDTYTEKQRTHVLRCVLCSITRIFGVSLSLFAIMSSIDSNVTLQTDWVLTPMTESC